ncbi:hypothetical protein PR048_005223 [Dryococelus australis]|uniref:NYN domain-containing protein n=1 Tax=Dryococelus australis TaxID=614101 RepID=A0ABQ9I837_9NEOP|nr:hypothetical protein PR048_005223 [Dryococelus australis]
MILGMENLFGVYQEELHKLFHEVSTIEKIIPDALESPVLVSFLASFERKCTALSEQSRTGKLWVQYFRQDLPDIKAELSEQHVELRDSRRTRDARIIAVLLTLFKEPIPWDVDCLQSIASGVVGDDSINCDQAEYFGLGAMKCIIGSNFGEVKLTQKNRVKPLSAVARSILILDDVVVVNSHQLFMRIVYVMKTENDLKHCPTDSYLEFVQKHHRVSVTVVFDCYNVHSPKSQEHFRRASKRTSAEIMFDMNTYASTTQADILSNHHINGRLITLLSHHFETARIEVCNSEGDANTLIVKKALELASAENNVTIVASDTDIAVMILARATYDMELRVLSPVFNSPESTKEEVCAAGEKFVIALCCMINVNSLDELRQRCDNISLSPVYEGWKLLGGFLVPILTSRAPAPESLLRLVFCGCKTDCGYRCECRRAGLAYSTMCGQCKGGSCMNIKNSRFSRK